MTCTGCSCTKTDKSLKFTEIGRINTMKVKIGGMGVGEEWEREEEISPSAVSGINALLHCLTCSCLTTVAGVLRPTSPAVCLRCGSSLVHRWSSPHQRPGFHTWFATWQIYLWLRGMQRWPSVGAEGHSGRLGERGEVCPWHHRGKSFRVVEYLLCVCVCLCVHVCVCLCVHVCTLQKWWWDLDVMNFMMKKKSETNWLLTLWKKSKTHKRLWTNVYNNDM